MRLEVSGYGAMEVAAKNRKRREITNVSKQRLAQRRRGAEKFRGERLFVIFSASPRLCARKSSWKCVILADNSARNAKMSLDAGFLCELCGPLWPIHFWLRLSRAGLLVTFHGHFIEVHDLLEFPTFPPLELTFNPSLIRPNPT